MRTYKNSSWKTRNLDSSSIYCAHDRFKDKCDKCKQKKKSVNKKVKK